MSKPTDQSTADVAGKPDVGSWSGLPPGDAELPRSAFRISLPAARPGEPPFEGPLDLLLHLVKEHQIDLFDIPIARITESYLATLRVMRELDIDIAGEFLQMAAQLMLMKSKLLLPRTEVAEDAAPEEAGVDPRAELVRRLLEYQKYKAAGEELGRHDILDRDVFVRRARFAPMATEGPEGLAEVSVFKLIEALDRALKNARSEIEHEVMTDRLTITDAISRVAEVLRTRGRVSFEELLGGVDRSNTRTAIIATFLAILEMAKLKLIRIFQSWNDEIGTGAEIVVEAKETLGEGGSAAPPPEDYR
jgi:segregation and condensation protein A